MPLPTARKRITATLAALIGATLVLAGCSNGTPSAEEDQGSAAVSGAFPATIDTARGEITVEEKPERIIALKPRHIELLHLLGEESFEYSAAPFEDSESLLEFYPWLEGSFEGEPATNLITADNTPSPEAIAALDPDLILTNIWGADDQLYSQLSQIAPTYVGIDPDTQTSWQDELAALATLTGHDSASVEEIKADYASELAAAAERLPGLQGKTFQVAVLAGDNILQLSDYANEPLLGLGLEPGEGQPTTGVEGLTAPKFSLENVDQLTADVLFIIPEKGTTPNTEFKEALRSDPRVAELPSAQNGTLIYLTPQEWTALNGGVSTSYLWWLDNAVPQLEESALNQSSE
ncbi:ABC transporter substrate-binding protein [Rhodococcus artemisiae]|uniref:ABC transporter substrate-binding protein n=1 Tax=Rhodococcus artemisiae TaxID=714159 RepID=A0ABU7LBY6_9NOCA|nr:ABC transporter substrate-binding protein [Rhodococcus artemisiae]MEE2059070.1 ABC transporter substrate-binding protein [Rhodococcus artemisiae]